MTESTPFILNRIRNDISQSGKSLILSTLISAEGQILKRLTLEVPLDEAQLQMSGFPNAAINFIRSIVESDDESGFLRFSLGEREQTVIVEAVTPRTSLLVFGAGHVGKALAQVANLVGYEVTIIDDRKDFLSYAKIPEAGIARLYTPFEEAKNHLTITNRTAIAIVTRGHQWDEICLQMALQTPARYIGMIGSRRRVLGVKGRLHNQGYSIPETEKIFAPIGLRIGARTPQEIAIAVLAEIIQVMNN